MKTKKSFLSGLCALALTVALAIGALVAYAPAKTANAAAADFNLSNVQVDSAVAYGDNIVVPQQTGYDVTVTNPSGVKNTLSDAADYTFAALELGHYVITYTKGGASYSFQVYSSIDEELELVVNDEAAIPTYVATGASVQLPGAKVGYYDEDGAFQEVTATVTAKTDKGAVINLAEAYTFDSVGSTFVTYSAQVLGGTKHVHKTYEVKVQDGFSDTKAPSLTVSGVPSSGNVNMAVTLPKATATDTLDAKVKVVVTVQGKNDAGNLENVKKVTVDKNDIAVATLEADEVFDNADNMTFYPRKTGDYKVTYQAFDDAGNASKTWTYTINVADKKAPVVTLDSTVTPAKWGYKTVKNATDALTDLKVSFPFPEFYDNSDAAESVKISFKLKNPAGTTIVNMNNINAAADDGNTKNTVSVPTIHENTYAFNKTMSTFAFDFGQYITHALNNNVENVTGDYVASYVAEDAAGNRATKSITINIAENFEDTSAVTVEFNAVDKYVKAGVKAVEWTVPAPKYTSTTDSTLALDYAIYAVDGGAEKISVKGGETVTVVNDGTKTVLSYDGADLELTANEIVLKATATSDAGNTATATETVKVLTTAANALFDTNVDVDTIALNADDAKNNKIAHRIGYMVVNGIAAADSKYVGIELGVKDSTDAYVDVTAEVYYVNGKMIVRDIAFETQKAGTYYVETRVFDIYGHSVINVKSVEIEEKTTPNYGTNAASVNFTSAAVNTKLLLSDDELVVDLTGTVAETAWKVDAFPARSHTVKGGRFALMGEELTAMQTGKYSVVDNYVLAQKDAEQTNYGADDAQLAAILAGARQTGEFTVSDDATVVFELHDVMPSYTAIKDGENVVVLPHASAFTTNTNATKIVLKVSGPNGTVVTPYTVEGENEVTLAADGIIEPGKTYNFKATANGTYTVTYTAYVAGATEKSFQYEIKAGDTIAPTFKLTDKSGNDQSHTTSVKTGHSFKFLYVALTNEADKNDAANFTFSKKVLGPDGEVVGGSVSGKGLTYANKETPSSGEIKFDASGTYTVVYTVTDAAGNVTTEEVEITVTKSSDKGGISLATLSTILIIVGVLLIAGVVIYLFRFRRVVVKKK